MTLHKPLLCMALSLLPALLLAGILGIGLRRWFPGRSAHTPSPA